MNLSMDVFLIITLSLTLIVAAVNDIRVQRIPNLVTYPSMAVAIGCHTMENGLEGFLFSVGGLAVGIGVFVVPYLMGGMGAGDAKLMGASGAIIGSKGVLIAILFTALVGGVYALILLLIKRQYLKRFINNLITPKTLVSTGQFIPIPETKDEDRPKLCYGVAIALGTALYIFFELSGHMCLA